MKITGIEIKHYLLPLNPPFKAAWDPEPRKSLLLPLSMYIQMKE